MVPAAAANVICICSFLVIFSTVWLGCFGCGVYKPFQRVTPRLLDRYKVKTTSSEFKSSLPFPAISHRSALARFGFHTSHCVGQWPPPTCVGGWTSISAKPCCFSSVRICQSNPSHGVQRLANGIDWWERHPL